MATILNYNFDANADGTLMVYLAAETGGPWARHPDSTGGDNTSVLAGNVGASSGRGIYYPAVAYASGAASMSATLASAAGSMYCGLRFQPPYTNFMLGGISQNNNAVEIYRCQGGYTLAASGTCNRAAGDVFTFEQTAPFVENGTTKVTFNVRRNGAVVLSFTDSAPILETNTFGFYLVGSSVASFTGTDSAATATPTIGTLSTTSASDRVTLALSAAVAGGSGSGYGYKVYRSVAPDLAISPATLIASPAAMPFDDVTAAANTLYYYRVVGLDGAGNTATAQLGGIAGITGGPYATPGQRTRAASTFLAGRSLGAVTLVAIGDSITAGATLANAAAQSPPTIMGAAIAAQSGSAVGVLNRAWSGTSVTEWQPGTAHWDAMVTATDAAVAANPTRAVVFAVALGVNDSAGGYANGNKTRAAFKIGLSTIVDELLTRYPSSKVVVLKPTYFSPNTTTSYIYSEASLGLILQYHAAIDEIAAVRVGRAFAGSNYNYAYFATNFASFTAEGQNRIHPNAAGAAAKGQADAAEAYNAITAPTVPSVAQIAAAILVDPLVRLDAARIDVATSTRGTSAYAGGDTPGTATLLARVTAPITTAAQQAQDATNLLAAIANVPGLTWAYTGAARTLTSWGTLVGDVVGGVWGAATRTITGGAVDAHVSATARGVNWQAFTVRNTGTVLDGKIISVVMIYAAALNSNGVIDGGTGDYQLDGAEGSYEFSINTTVGFYHSSIEFPGGFTINADNDFTPTGALADYLVPYVPQFPTDPLLATDPRLPVAGQRIATPADVSPIVSVSGGFSADDRQAIETLTTAVAEIEAGEGDVDVEGKLDDIIAMLQIDPPTAGGSQQFQARKIVRGDTYGSTGRPMPVVRHRAATWPEDLSAWTWSLVSTRDASNGNVGADIVGTVGVTAATGPSRSLAITLAGTSGVALGRHVYAVRGLLGGTKRWSVELGVIDVVDGL